MRLILSLLLLSAIPAVAQDAGIVGPDESQPGNMVVFLAADPPAEAYKWKIVPKSAAGQFFSFTERDDTGKIIKSTAVFSSRTPGTYSVVLARVTGGQLSLDTHTLANGGDEPPPGPEPDPDNPDPPGPEPGPTEWAAWTTKTVEQVIPSDGRSEAATTMANAIQSVVLVGGEGVYEDTSAFRSTMKRTVRMAMGEERSELWESKFDNPLLTPAVQKLMDEGKLETMGEHCRLYGEIAKGLRAVK